MNKQLTIKGQQEFIGINIPIIEGGFGENQKAMLAKTIAEIHGIELKRINELINNNIDEFEIGVDLLDLCKESFKVVATDLGFITSNGQKYCYLLSEQGYMLLVGFMKTEKAKEIRKKLRREYFTMRQIINSDEQLKAQLLMSIYNGGQDGIIASKKLTEIEVKEAIAHLHKEIEENKPLVEFGNQVLKSSDNILVRELSKLAFEQGMNIGEKKLYKQLREWNYIMQNSTEPYQSALNQGLFVVEEKPIKTPYGTRLTKTTKITPKGQIFIIEKLRKEFK